MRKSLTIFVCSFIGLVSFAQQDAQFSMNMFNRVGVNPGYAGTNYAGYKSQGICATLLYRNQWTGFNGGPKSILFSADYGNIFGGGIGLTVSQDKAGFEKTTMAKLAYSYHLHIGSNGGVLGLGLDAGMLQKGLNGNFIAPDGSTINNQGTDPSIPWQGAAATTYDLGFGIYYTTKKLYIGLSSLHLPEQTLKKGENFDYTVARHYYIMAGYTFIGQKIDITPSILTKSDATSTQLDINLMAKWQKMLFFGVSYRLTDAAVAIVGLEYRNFKVGYAYDYTLSSLKNHSSGSHEIMLGFCHKFPKPEYKQSHVNVRFL
ncbi:MAG TPA: type IX secretion system membrane protein PorP/SprF [Bacteroidia bacterium]|nr:type IX secretion system membrane protein PorP/SprF [Bacteroidia bacterium]HRG51295.1 type IX secretion system membrane protein PorP/SprF [Bacteroidia bacterium]